VNAFGRDHIKYRDKCPCAICRNWRESSADTGAKHDA
jgi:hypothetical protein